MVIRKSIGCWLSRHGRVQWTQHSQLPRFGAVGLKSLNAETYIGLSLRASLFKIFKKRATVLRQMTNKLHIIRTRRMAMCTLISDVSENVEWKYGCSLQRNSFSRLVPRPHFVRDRYTPIHGLDLHPRFGLASGFHMVMHGQCPWLELTLFIKHFNPRVFGVRSYSHRNIHNVNPK